MINAQIRISQLTDSVEVLDLLDMEEVVIPTIDVAMGGLPYPRVVRLLRTLF